MFGAFGNKENSIISNPDNLHSHYQDMECLNNAIPFLNCVTLLATNWNTFD
jgi:hypothetical protein